MIARVLHIAAVIVTLCVAGRAQGASSQPGSRDLQPGCRSRLSALAACSSLPAWTDSDARPCCDAIVAFHSFGCFCESYDKSDEAAALEAAALLDSLRDSLYVRCPAISGQLPPAQPCSARSTDASSSGGVARSAAVLAGPGDDPLFGDAQGSATAASQDTRNPPRRISSATAAGDRHSFDGEEGDQAAYDSESHAWSLSSLEAAPLEASSVASMDGSDESDPIAGIWHRLSSEEGRRTGHSGAQFPSGFVVDDLQSSSAALPLRAGLAAAASHAASGSRAAVETVHDLHDPMGRGTGKVAAISGVRRAEGLLVSRYTPGNTTALQRSDEQRHAANVAASAAHAAGATQRELARVRAAVDRTDIDATLAAATLSSASEPFEGRAANAHGRHHAARYGTLQTEAQRLFGDHSKGQHTEAAWQSDAGAAHTLDVEVRLIVEHGAQPTVEVITEHGMSGRATGVSVSALDGSAGTASLLRPPHLAAMLSSFLQRQRGGGGGGSPVTVHASRRFGPGHYTAGLLHADGASSAIRGSAAAEPMSLYRLRLARSQPQPQRLFSAAHVVAAGSASEAADSFDVDVDIELLPVSSAFLASVGEGSAWLRGAATGARGLLRNAVREVAGWHVAARTWTCEHRRLLLALLAAQLALTALLALAARACPEAAAKRRTKAAMRCGAVSAADEVRAQLAQPLLSGDAEVDGANPLHGMLAVKARGTTAG